jgi:palmitoyltransferase ZDHHC6
MQNIGFLANIEAVLGKNPLMWCCPSIPAGDGLKYPIVEADGRWSELTVRHREGDSEESDEEDAGHQA